MRKISRTISLEQFKSRTPSLVRAFNGENVVEFNTNSFITGNVLMGNYGLVPLNVIKDGKDYSWSTISSMHTFFIDYLALLNSNDGCNARPYNNAEDYYNYSVKPQDPNETFKSQYLSLDEQFADYGGQEMVTFVFNTCYNEVVIPWGQKFIYKNNEYTLPYELYQVWGTSVLNYVAIYDELGWFEPLYQKYAQVNASDCATQEDCCECKSYFRKGGNIMYYWLSSVPFPDVETGDERLDYSYTPFDHIIECNKDTKVSIVVSTEDIRKDAYQR